MTPLQNSWWKQEQQELPPPIAHCTTMRICSSIRSSEATARRAGTRGRAPDRGTANSAAASRQAASIKSATKTSAARAFLKKQANPDGRMSAVSTATTVCVWGLGLSTSQKAGGGWRTSRNYLMVLVILPPPSVSPLLENPSVARGLQWLGAQFWHGRKRDQIFVLETPTSRDGLLLRSPASSSRNRCRTTCSSATRFRKRRWRIVTLVSGTGGMATSCPTRSWTASRSSSRSAWNRRTTKSSGSTCSPSTAAWQVMR
mmetsp:Transcript_21323/g.53706  ORF Transcript_21323/g.53706 Transcript_21323/m.53706 type:complete len:258 (+) Transcript_21323:402-1175(+)